jgi:4-amino-4-deoxy-L-arabinose transferase-like glycosyltransferase
MRKWVLMALLAVFFLAIFMRLVPLTYFEVWGSDTGEYYRISSQLTSEGYISTDYDGWGFSYPDFPGIYSVSGSANLLMGVDNLAALSIVIPVVASLSVLVVFFIAKLLFGKDEAGLVASALVAVAMPHVFPTSHAVPGSLGDLLLLSSILLLLLSIKNKKFFPLLILTSMALTITHHLSSYFLFFLVLGGLFAEEILRSEDKKDLRLGWGFLFFFLTLLIFYWTVAATPFADRVVSMAFDLPLPLVLSFGYLAIILALLIIKIRRWSSWSYEPKLPKLSSVMIYFSIQLFLLFFTLLLISFVSIPGTNMKIDPIVVLMFGPLLVLLAFVSFGTGYLRLYKSGMMIYGWIIALLLSLLISVVTSNHVLLSYRHPQYLMMPLALTIGLGLAMIYALILKDSSRGRRWAITSHLPISLSSQGRHGWFSGGDLRRRYAGSALGKRVPAL